MRKTFKISAISMLCLTPMLALAGCGEVDKLSLMKDNLSEASDVYYFSDNIDFLVSIASGKREDPYQHDGKSEKKVDFALVIAELNGSDSELVKITINGEEKNVVLEFNYQTGTHMADIETKLSGEEEIKISYMDKSANMVCKSNSFAVSSDKALELAYQNMKEDVDKLCEGKNFKGECYLKILDNLSGGFDDVFWLFSVLDQNGKMQNVIISTSEPKILADGKQSSI